MSRMKFGDFAINCTEKKIPSPEDFATYIGLEHMDTKCLTISRWGSDVPIIGEKLIMHKGDILLGKRNAYLRRAAIAPHDGIFSAHGMILRPKTNVVDYDFFALFIASDYFFDEAIRISVGSLSPTINWKDLKEIEFDIPSLEIQKQVSKSLWAINNTIESYKNLESLCDEMISSKMIEMFGSYKSKNANYRKLLDVCDFQGGTQPPKKDWISESRDGYIRMLQIRDFTQPEKNNIEFVKETKVLKKCTEDDILIARYGASVGKILNGLSGAYNVAIMKSIPDTTIINKTYLKYYFLTDYFQSFLNIASSGRAAQAGFSKDDLEDAVIIVPSIKEQEKFVEFTNMIESLKIELKASIDSLEKMYKKIFVKNMTIEEA